MRTIEIGCYCGHELKTELEARHDFLRDGEDMVTVAVSCPVCGMRARIHVGVDVIDYGKELA